MADIQTIHLSLLTNISNQMDPASAEYQNFITHMTNKVPRGLLSTHKTIIDKLRCLETKGVLSPGHYDTLKQIADLSGNIDITELIRKAESDIKNIQGKFIRIFWLGSP